MKSHRSGGGWLALTLGLVLASCTCAWAAQGLEATRPVPFRSVAPSPTEITRDEIERRHAEVAREAVEAARVAVESAGETRERRLRELALLERLALLYPQEGAILDESASLEEAKGQAEQGLQLIRAAGLGQKPPYRLEELDALYEELDGESRRSETLEATVKIAEAGLSQAKSVQAEREAQRRQAKEAAAGAADPAARALLLDELREVELRSRLAGEMVVLRQLELKRELLARDLSALALARLRERARRMAAHTVFSREDFERRLAEIEERSARLAKALAEQEGRAESAQAQWWQERERLRSMATADPAAQERLATLREAYEAKQKEVNILGQRLQRLEEAKELWRRRFALALAQAQAGEISAWRREAKQNLEQIAREERAQRALLADARKEALALTEKIAKAAKAGEAVAWGERHQRYLGRLIEVYEANLASLEASRRLHERLLEEAERQRALRPLGERVRAAWAIARDVWRYEIASVDDRPITVGKVFVALVLLTLGFRMARLASRLVGHRILPRFRVPTGAATALESITYYISIVVVTLVALRAVNIPLTAFTLVGGALAIGIGFGSQTIVNNFISGLILLIERPIGAGDLIELEGVLGTVEQIGARSTRVRTFDNTHVLVPNSFFLENRFVNWTLSDNVVRGHVQVGVAYGSPTDEVARLLLQAASEREQVLSWPQPLVRFSSFGDNALVFDLYFWLRPLSERWEVESAVRFRVDQLFRQAAITIAYPQRDIHLDSARPVEVRLVGKRGEWQADAHPSGKK